MLTATVSGSRSGNWAAHLAHWVSASRDPGPDVDDQVRRLGDRDELGRGDHAPARVPPPQQGLARHDLVGPEADLGLVEEDELAPLAGAVEGVLELGAAHGPGPQLLVEEPDGTAPDAAGELGGGVGVADELVGGHLARPTEGDAGRGGQEHLAATDAERFGERVADVAGEGVGRDLAVDRLAQHDEVLVAPAVDALPLAQVFGDPLGDGLEQQAGRPLFEPVDLLLEPVGGHEEDAHRGRIVVHPPQQQVETVEEEGPVRRPVSGS